MLIDKLNECLRNYIDRQHKLVGWQCSKIFVQSTGLGKERQAQTQHIKEAADITVVARLIRQELNPFPPRQDAGLLDPLGPSLAIQVQIKVNGVPNLDMTGGVGWRLVLQAAQSGVALDHASQGLNSGQV